jgi:hypothetical protein
VDSAKYLFVVLTKAGIVGVIIILVLSDVDNGVLRLGFLSGCPHCH